MKLGLGTVQFGLDYGVANRDGKVPPAEISRMLALAARNGISILDTAHHYGTSERALGEALPVNGNFRVVTKTPRFDEEPLTELHADRLEAAAAESLTQLRRKRLYGLLIHHTADALAAGSECLFDRLKRLKERGWVEKIGVSVYGPDELERVLDRHPIDLVQIPFNVLDQRLARRELLLSQIRRCGIEVHARSAFLQGLLLLPPDRIDPYFAPWRSTLIEFRRRALAAGLSPLMVAERFVLSAPFVDAVIVGAVSAKQLAEIVSSARTTAELPNLEDLAVDDERIINPGCWTLKRPKG